MKKFASLLAGLLMTISLFSQQTFSDFQDASMVIGQPDFGSQLMNHSDSIAYRPSHLAISSQGMLAVAEGSGGSIKIWFELPDSDGQPADVEVGNPDFNTVDPGPSESFSDGFNGVAWSPDGNKLIASCGNQNRVLIWNSIPASNGQPADVVLGQIDFTSTASSTKKNTLNYPAGVLVTPEGKLLVADKYNNRVLIWNTIPVSNGKDADVVIGQPGFNSNTPGADADQLHYPNDVNITSDGKLLVTNELSHQVFVYDAVPITDGESAAFVIGHDDFGNSSSGTSETELNMPASAIVISDGKLVVAEFGNNRVLIYNSFPTASGAKADLVLGQENFTSSIDYAPSGSPSSNNFSGVSDVVSDLNGRLWVAGTSMNRVMVFGDLPAQTADLNIEIELSDLILCESSDIVYKISITNTGPDTAFNVDATAVFPLGFTFENSKTEIGSYNNSSGHWKIPSIASSETVSLYIDGFVNKGTKTESFTSYANIVGSSAWDDNLSNNSTSTVVTIQSIKLPVDPIVSDVYICEGDMAMLFADGSGTIQWFSEDDIFTPVEEGLSYSTVPLTETTTYYVKTNDVCPGSERVPVQAIVTPNFSLSETVDLCSGSNFVYPDGVVHNNITSSETHVSYLNTIYGCDSTITTNVEVLPGSYEIDSFTVCSGSSFVFPDGTTYDSITSSTEYTSNFLKTNGCDSIIVTRISVIPSYFESESVTLCSGSSYTFPDGTTQTDITSSQIHTSNLISANSCDSIIETEIIILPVYDILETVSVCEGDDYTFPDGTTADNIISSISHTSSFISSGGCDSIITTEVEVITVDVSVMKDGNTLTANASGVDYQWLDCNSGNVSISGEISQSLIASQAGSYAVQITESLCTSTSDCYEIAMTEIDENNMNQEFRAYPNPTKDNITIFMGGFSQYINVSVLDMQGQIVLEQIVENGEDAIHLDLQDLKNGMYMIHLNTDKKDTILKILKE